MDACSLELMEKLKKFYKKDEDLALKVEEFKYQVNDIFKRADKEHADPIKLIQEKVNENSRQIEMDAFRRMQQIKSFKEAAKQVEQFSDPEKGFKSLLFTRHGEEYVAKGSLEQLVSSEKNRRIAILKRELGEDQNILQRLKDGDPDLEEQIYKLEYGEYSQAELGQVSKDAIKAHKAIKKLNNYDYRSKKILGADVGYKQRRMFRQSHDPQNMQDMGQKNWVNLGKEVFTEESIMRRIEGSEELSKKYEKAADPVDAFLNDQYEKIINNESQRAVSIDDTFQSLQFMGQQRAWEKSTTFEFKNAQAQMKYNRELNNKSLFENLAQDIIRDSGSTGSMQLLGPNPNQTVQKLIEQYGLKKGDQLKKDFRFAAGRKAGVATGMLARSAEKARKLSDMALLSTSLASTLPDFAIAANVISSKTGKNYFTTLGGLIKENIKTIPKKQRQEYSRRLSILMDDELFDYHRIGEDGKFATSLDPFKSAVLEDKPMLRFAEGVGRKVGGGIDYAHNKVMRMTGLPAQSQIMRLASVKNYAMYLSDVSSQSFDSLYKGTKTLFDRMGIGEREWDIIRTKAVKDADDGSRFLDAESILDLTKEDVGMSNEADFNRYVFGLHSKVSGMYDFLANTSSPTPGVRSKLWVETVDPDTVAGVLARTVAQYKSFSISVYNSMREAYGPRFDKDRTLKLAYTMTTGMALAYLGLAAKETAKGKEVPELKADNPAEFAKFSAGLLARSGTAGLMFDFLSTDYHSPWRSLGADIMGPSPRIAENVMGIMKAPANILMAQDSKESKKAKRNLLNDLEDTMPSIPFTRTMINENIFDILHKSLNTGAKRK